MKRLIFIFVVATLLSPLSAWLNVQPAGAISGWKAGNIMEDAVMADSTTMSTSQIQSFLNKQLPSCDTYGKQLSEYGGPDLNNDGKVQRWEWGKKNYNQTKFVCLKNYKISDGRTAAKVIRDVSRKYSVNPRVLIVLLQKEQGLVKDTWPLKIQYRSATGYGCPDTAPCNSDYYGLLNQLKWAAKMFRAILNNSPTWYTPYVLGNNYIRYNPSSSCGGSVVNIRNRATQALYNYTPYQPNKAALQAGWGTASCGAYGNRNFYLYFTSWFGTTRGTEADKANLAIDEYYSNLGGSSGSLGPRQSGLDNSAHTYWKRYENGYIVWSPTTGAWESLKGPIRERWNELGLHGGKLGYPTGTVNSTSDTNGEWQAYENGYIVWSPTTGAWESLKGPIRERWNELGRESGALGYPTGAVRKTADGGYWQAYENGYIVWSPTTGAWESLKGPIRERWNELGLHGGKLGYPTGTVNSTSDTNGEWQAYENGYIVWSPTTGAWESLKGPIRERWNELGRESGALGYPTGAVLDLGVDQRQLFQNGIIESIDGTVSVSFN